MSASKSEKIIIHCEPRTVLGKGTRSLRAGGMVPANIFGEKQDSLSVSVSFNDFVKAFRAAGETHVVYCEVDGKEIPTLIYETIFQPVDDTVLHVDFRRVNLKKEIDAQVPVKVVGESPAIKAGGVLLTLMQEVQVRALPDSIPESIQIDVSTINDIGTEVKISDLPKSSSYTITEDADRVVVSIVEHKEESTEAQIEKKEVEITTAKPDDAAAEGAEGAAEGAKPEAAAEPEAKPEKK